MLTKVRFMQPSLKSSVLCRGEQQITGDGLYMKSQSLHPIMKSVLRNEPCHKHFTESHPAEK